EYLLEGVTQVFGADRADSVQDRLENDDLMIQRAVERPVFGWGGWGRNRVYVKAQGEDSSVTDGLWIIAFGTRGWVGLLGVCLSILLPAARFAWYYPPRRWIEPELAPAAVI